MPASCRSATRPSSASAPTSPGCWRSTASAIPWSGLVAAGLAAAALLGFVTSFLVLRGADLTRLMVTLGVALVLGEIANQASWLTGGADGLQGVTMGPLLGLFEFDIFGTTAYAYSLVGDLPALRRWRAGSSNSPFGLSLRSIRDNPLRARAIGIPVNRRLVAIYTVSAAYAGVAGALLAQTTQFVSLDVLAFHRSADVLLVLVIGGVGYLYGGLIGAVVFKVLQDVLAGLTPQYWQFWIGLILVVLVLAGRERLTERRQRCGARAAGSVTGRRPLPAAPPSGRSDVAPALETERPGQALRRPHRHRRRVVPAGAGRAPRAHRPERRRQDDLHQPPHRRSPADRRADPPGGRRHHAAAAGDRGSSAASPAPSRSTSSSRP